MRRPGRIRNPLRFEDYPLLAAVTLTPWAFGGGELWAFRSASLLIALSAGWALWKRGWAGWGLGRGDAGWLLPALLLALLAGAQVVPLPPGLIRVVSPATYALYAESFPGYPDPSPPDPLAAIEALALDRIDARAMVAPSGTSDWPGLEIAPPLSDSTWKPLSVQPSITLERLMWYLTLLMAFLVGRTRVADPSVARIYRWALFASFFALACFGLLQWRTWNGKIYWLREIVEGSRPFGPYTNPIHFAGVMELAVPWMVGYAWSRNLRRNRDANVALTLLTGFAALTCLAAALAAASKMGAVLLVASLGLLALFGLPTQKKRVTFLLMSALILTLSGLMVSQTDLGKRFGDHLARAGTPTELLGLRWVAWKSTGPMLADYPAVGTGFGTYREVFQSYRPPGDSRRMTFTHNDYLEVLLEGGLIGGALLLWLTAAYGRSLWRRLRSRKPVSLHRLGRALGVGSLAIHGLFDFNHQIPANALLFVVCAAMTVPFRNPEPGRGGADRLWADRPVFLGLLAVGILLTFSLRAATGIPAGKAWADGVRLDQADRKSEALEAFVRADVGEMQLQALRRSSAARMSIWDRQASDVGAGLADDRLLNGAAEDLLRAIRIAPASADPWAGLSRVYLRMERALQHRRSRWGPIEASGSWAPRAESDEASPPDPWSRVQRPGRISLGILTRALDLAPNWYINHDRMARTLWEFGLEEEAAEAVRAAAASLPRFTGHIFWRDEDFPAPLKEAFIDGTVAARGRTGFLSERVRLVDLAKLQRQLGHFEEAREALLEARELPGTDQDYAEIELNLGLIDLLADQDESAWTRLENASRHPVFRPSALRNMATIASRTDRHEEAYDLLVRSRREDPSNVGTALQLAEASRVLGRYRTAIDLLEELIDFDPDTIAFYVRLGRVYIEDGDLGSLNTLVETMRDRFGAAAEIEQLVREAEPAEEIG